MGKALRITLVVIGVLAVAGGLVFAGAWIGHGSFYHMGGSQAPNGMMNGSGGFGPGKMNFWGGRGYDTGPGMLGGYGNGYGPGMMNAYGSPNPSAAPLTVEQAFQAATTYLAGLNNPDLKIAEVMVFSNNAYVRVIEQSTGTGAFELLVNPSSLAVTPEPGPNMMWNLKYGGMNHQGMMGNGGMMGRSISNAAPAAVYPAMSVTAAQALQAAQAYLITAQPGTTTATDADPFYGYYTIDILRGGNIIGMLSVNGYNSQVFLHTWHGTFISTQDY